MSSLFLDGCDDELIYKLSTQWEKTVQHGIVRFNDGKPERVTRKNMLAVLQNQSAFDPGRVRDYRHNTKLPVGNCIKPPKLMCKFTELPCFHCPAYVLTPEDLPALEAYEQQLLERIEIGKQANNTYWIEINQKNLEERLRPAIRNRCISLLVRSPLLVPPVLLLEGSGRL